MQRINEVIKSGQFHKAYLLFGEQDYLRKQARDRLVKALTGGENTMNYTYFEGKNVSVEEVIDLAETLPFLAERRVIVLENTGWFKNGESTFATYLENSCETTVLICVEREVDRKTTCFKALGKVGVSYEFGNLDENQIKQWIFSKIQKDGKKITNQAMAFFLSRVGSNMEVIQRELEKLLCYCMEREEITMDDIEAVCTRQIEDHVFDMIRAMASKDQKRAFDLYNDLLALRVPTAKILSLIVREFNMLLQVKSMKAEGHDEKQMAAATKLPPWAVHKYVVQSTKFKRSYLMQAMEECAEMDEATKTGRMNDQMGLELLLIQFSS